MVIGNRARTSHAKDSPAGHWFARMWLAGFLLGTSPENGGGVEPNSSRNVKKNAMTVQEGFSEQADRATEDRVAGDRAAEDHTTAECTATDHTAEPQLSDEGLLAAYRQTGDRRLFAALVQRYERELYNYLRRYLGDAEQAEDVFQTACLMVHLKCGQFEPGRRFRPWLYAIATNAAIDAQRREKRHRAVSLDRNRKEARQDEPKLTDMLMSNDPDPFAEASRLESGAWVQEALDGLTGQMRDVVHLVYFQGLKYREAAEALNVPVGTIKSRMNAAVTRLQDFWKQSHDE